MSGVSSSIGSHVGSEHGEGKGGETLEVNTRGRGGSVGFRAKTKPTTCVKKEWALWLDSIVFEREREREKSIWRKRSPEEGRKRKSTPHTL